jgi:hypothetical protein
MMVGQVVGACRELLLLLMMLQVFLPKWMIWEKLLVKVRARGRRVLAALVGPDASPETTLAAGDVDVSHGDVVLL